MDQSRDDRITALVDSCAAMRAEEREKYLSIECADDPLLQPTVEMIFEKGGDGEEIRDISRPLERGLPSHYRLVRMLGTGGMAEVFLAEDTRLGRHVAIKFLNQTFRADPELMRRFNLEARSASALNHPNIITIHDIGETDGVQYIVSEYIDGESLRLRLKRGRLSVRECLEITTGIASAIGAAHAIGLVHRDLKPDNIMLRKEGSVKVVDFGLAKAAGSATASSSEAATLALEMTSPGMILGTPSHMSPEQARGLLVDGRSDIFSLGTIMYEMLTGRSPFAADSTADIIAAVLNKQPPDINEIVSGVPDELILIVEKALKKDRDKRYPSVENLLIDLDNVRGDLVLSSGLVTANGHAEKTVLMPGKRRHPYLLYPAIAIAVLLAVFGLWRLLPVRGSSALLDPAVLRNVPITSWPTFTSEGIAAARFSPDGRMIAFTSKKSGSSEIYVKLIAGGEIAATKNGFDNGSPLWTPDGQNIAYVSTRNGVTGIWRVSFAGGAETQIVSGIPVTTHLDRWSTDGTLFVDDVTGISTIDPTTRTLRPVVDFGQIGIKPRAVAVSEDGKAFAVAVNEEGIWKIRTKRFDDKDLVEIASSKDQVDTLVFAADGKSLFYAGGTNGVAQIYQTASDGRSTVQISNGPVDSVLHDVSGDGTRVLYSAVEETSDLWQATVPDGKESVIANDVAEEFWPDISPDGKSVAYQSMSQPERPYSSTLYVKSRASAGDARQLPTEGFCPVWSNDGQWITFFHRESSGISLWKVRPSGADAAMVTEGVSFSYGQTPYLKLSTDAISWSPDNRSIVFARSSLGVTNIWLGRSDGSGRRQLTSNTDSSTSYCCASWTHDGSHITWLTSTASNPPYGLWMMSSDGQDVQMIKELNESFESLGFAAGDREVLIAKQTDTTDRSQTVAETDIYAVSIDKGSMRKICTISNAYFNNIQLSRTGRTIAFVSRSGNNTELWTVPAAGGPPKKILTENDPKIMFSTVAWSPDGSSVAFGKQTRTNLLSMLTK